MQKYRKREKEVRGVIGVVVQREMCIQVWNQTIVEINDPTCDAVNQAKCAQIAVTTYDEQTGRRTFIRTEYAITTCWQK